MKITIYSGELTPAEARGLVAFLIATHGEGIIPATVEKVTGAVAVNVTNQVSDTLAADGFPSPPPVTYATGDPDPVKTEDGARYFPVGCLDSAGIPWDERIHSSTKGTNKDGTWSRRRNTPDELFASVMAELKARTAAPRSEYVEGPDSAPPTEPTAAAAFSAPPAAAAAVIPPPPPAASTGPVQTPIPASIPLPPVTGSAPTFVQLMTVVTGAQKAGKLDKAELDELLASCGIAGLGKLATADEGTRAAFDAVLTAALT